MSVKCIAWVYDTKVGDPYAKALLAKLADNANDAGVAWPSIELLSEQTEIPMRTVKKKMALLRDLGFITVAKRRASGGQYDRNVYQLAVPWAPGAPGEQPTGGTGDTRPGAPGAPVARVVPFPEPSGGTVIPPIVPPAAARGPATVDKRRVTDEERALAINVLASWNAATGQRMTSDDWLARIIRRHREHPELGIEDFEFLISHTLGQDWWSGTPQPDLVFGNAAQLERCIAAANSPARRPRRFGRGMTTAEMLEGVQ